MKITIVCVGKVKEKYLRDAIAEYEKSFYWNRFTADIVL